ncbi:MULTISPECIES: dynamin family protein [Lactococcus]|uniref:dynamin family protein n=1 Tax=Lactococcus TaxID=1357 RepID=UPI0022E16BE9|nr:dynamin family protein [Lactococcus garvieae]
MIDLSDLKNFRERLNMTQQEMADRIGVSKASISNWEASPENLTLDKLQQYLNVVGLKVSDFEEQKEGKKLKIKVNKDTLTFRSELQTAFNKLEKAKIEITKGDETSIFNTIYSQTMNDLKKLQGTSRKVRVMVVGESDTGKSTFINHIVGQNIVPAHWEPATGMAIKILHSSEKPKWMMGNTLIVKNNLKEEFPVESWDLRDRDYFKSHVLEEGGIEIVSNFGEREGEEYDKNNATEQVIFTYVDSEILNAIEVWDTPGTGAGKDATSTKDEQVSIDARNNADVIVYLSSSPQFMHEKDFLLLRNDLEKLPKNFDEKHGLSKFSNAYIVASQADMLMPITGGGVEELELEISRKLSGGAKRFDETLSDEFYEQIGGTRSQLKNRYFAFTMKPEFQKICDKFNSDFSQFIEVSQEIVLESSVRKRDELVRSHISDMRKTKEKIENDRVNHDQLVKEAENKEANLDKILTGNEALYHELKNIVQDSRKVAKKDFETFYNSTISKSYLNDLIETGGFKNNKDDKEIFVNKISNLLAERHKSVMEKQAERFKDKLDKVVETTQISTGVSTSFFDYKAAVLGLVSSGVTVGVFAAVAATITSNLGLYILVAQIGGILTTAGIISSPIIATSTVAAFGGPVTWVIGIAVAAGAAIYSLFHRNAWKGKLIDNIIKSYSEEDALNQYLLGIDSFMDDSLNGVESIKKGLDLAATKDVEIAIQRSEADDKQFDLEIKQVGEFLKKFEGIFQLNKEV